MCLVYVLGLMTFEQIKIYLNKASLALSDSDKKEMVQMVRSHFDTDILDENQKLDSNVKIEIKSEYINDDKKKDIVAIVESSKTCGGGGCISTMYIQDDYNGYSPINFQFAVKEIDVMSTLTNNMHDIMINGDTKSMMTWNGSQYVLNAY